jgi:hypothetical protein
MVLDSDIEANSGTNLNLLWQKVTARVLDGCSQPRNQRGYQNLPIH